MVQKETFHVARFPVQIQSVANSMFTIYLANDKRYKNIH